MQSSDLLSLNAENLITQQQSQHRTRTSCPPTNTTRKTQIPGHPDCCRQVKEDQALSSMQSSDLLSLNAENLITQQQSQHRTRTSCRPTNTTRKTQIPGHPDCCRQVKEDQALSSMQSSDLLSLNAENLITQQQSQHTTRTSCPPTNTTRKTQIPGHLHDCCRQVKEDQAVSSMQSSDLLSLNAENLITQQQSQHTTRTSCPPTNTTRKTQIPGHLHDCCRQVKEDQALSSMQSSDLLSLNAENLITQQQSQHTTRTSCPPTNTT